MFDPVISQALLRSGRRIIVTGAGGWLGLATLDSLAAALGERFFERVAAFGSAARELILQDGRVVRQQPLEEIARLAAEPTWVLHFAFLTKDRAEAMDETAYREANASISNTVLAALDPIGAEAVFVASSGAAYKAQDPTASSAMSLYGRLKAEDETRFAHWGEIAQKRVVIARIFNVTGPYINKHQAYALASFILDGIAGRTIEVRAPRRVVRGYVPIDEVMSLALAEMAAACSGTSRFDTGGKALELGEVAQAVARCFPGLAVRRAALTEAADDVYHGDDRVYGEALARHRISRMPLEAQILKTIDYLRGQQ